MKGKKYALFENKKMLGPEKAHLIIKNFIVTLKDQLK